MEKVKITAVSYLNTKPLLYGLLQSELANQIDLSLDIPSVCAQSVNLTVGSVVRFLVLFTAAVTVADVVV